MKELSVEEKAKRYNEALERAKKLYEQGTITESLSYIFPELEESEDERIRKCIGDVVREHDWSHIFGVTKDDCLSWLEKQGEQILANSTKTCKDEQEPTDEEMKTLLRTEYEKGRADAIAEIEMQKLVDCIDCTNSKGCINCKDGNMKETLVRKTAWSKEDEEELDIAISTLKEAGQHDSAKWLKFLKDRVQPKQEWSEEDDLILETIIDHIIPDKPFIANGFVKKDDYSLTSW